MFPPVEPGHRKGGVIVSSILRQRGILNVDEKAYFGSMVTRF